MKRLTRRTRLGEGITGEPLSGCAHLPIVRVRLKELHTCAASSEITCTQAELPAIVAWAIARRGVTRVLDLPVPEFWRTPWTRNYRWTLAADLVLRLANATAA